MMKTCIPVQQEDQHGGGVRGGPGSHRCRRPRAETRGTRGRGCQRGPRAAVAGMGQGQGQGHDQDQCSSQYQGPRSKPASRRGTRGRSRGARLAPGAPGGDGQDPGWGGGGEEGQAVQPPTSTPAGVRRITGGGSRQRTSSFTNALRRAATGHMKRSMAEWLSPSRGRTTLDSSITDGVLRARDRREGGGDMIGLLAMPVYTGSPVTAAATSARLSSTGEVSLTAGEGGCTMTTPGSREGQGAARGGGDSRVRMDLKRERR